MTTFYVALIVIIAIVLLLLKRRDNRKIAEQTERLRRSANSLQSAVDENSLGEKR